MEEMNREYVSAMKARDISWFERTCAPDFYQMTGKSKSDRATAINNFKTSFTQISSFLDIFPKIISLKEDRKGVTIVNETKYVVLMKPLDHPGPVEKRDFTYNFEEYWTHVGKKWQLHYLKLLIQEATPAPVKTTKKPPVKGKKGGH